MALHLLVAVRPVLLFLLVLLLMDSFKLLPVRLVLVAIERRRSRGTRLPRPPSRDRRRSGSRRAEGGRRAVDRRVGQGGVHHLAAGPAATRLCSWMRPSPASPWAPALRLWRTWTISGPCRTPDLGLDRPRSGNGDPAWHDDVRVRDDRAEYLGTAARPPVASDCGRLDRRGPPARGIQQHAAPAARGDARPARRSCRIVILLVFRRSEAATHEWITGGLDLDLELLQLVQSEEFVHTRFGSYLRDLKDRCPRPAGRGHVLPAACRARAGDSGESDADGTTGGASDSGRRRPAREPRRVALSRRNSIGRTGLLALEPLQVTSDRDKWHKYLLQQSRTTG